MSCSPPSRRVLLSVYRSLLRSSLVFDFHPQLKSLATPGLLRAAPPEKFPAAAHFIKQFFGHNASFYIPTKSFYQGIRKAFRAQKEAAQAPGEILDLVNSAFFMLRVMNKGRAIMKRVSSPPSSIVNDPDPAASISSSLPGWRLSSVFPMGREMENSIESYKGEKTNKIAKALEKSRHRSDARPSAEKYHSLVSSVPLSAGMFLAAHPAFEGDFRQSLILIVEHSEAAGTVGVVVNDPLPLHAELSGLTPAEARLVRVYEELFDPSFSQPLEFDEPRGRSRPAYSGSANIMCGGPVAGLVTLHRYSSLADSGDFVSRPVLEHPQFPIFSAGKRFWGHLKELGAQEAATRAQGETKEFADPSNVSLYVGKCTWRPGQLREELSEGAWLLMEGSGRHVFVKKEEKIRNHKKPTEVQASEAVLDIVESGDSEPLATILPQAPKVAALLNSSAPEFPEGSKFPAEHLWRHAMFQCGGDLQAFAQYHEIEYAAVAEEQGRKKEEEDEEDDEEEDDEEEEENDEDEEEEDDEA